MPFFKKEQKAINDKWYPPVPADLKSSYSHPRIVNPGGTRGDEMDEDRMPFSCFIIGRLRS